MKLSEQLTDYINAAFTGLWVQTHEADEAEREILRLAKDHEWKVAVWDVAGGLRTGSGADPGPGDPLAPLRALPALADPKGTALLLLHNYHPYLKSPEVIQTLLTQLIEGKHRRTFVIVLSPVLQIPIELEKLFLVVEHDLPDREQIRKIVQGLTAGEEDAAVPEEAMEGILDAAAGLTRYEAEGAFALSLTRHNAIQPKVIWELKAQSLKKNNLLMLHRGNETFDSLGGLDNLKQFCRQALRADRGVQPRGVLLLGVSGTGKAQPIEYPSR